jgi:hypothetical protein
MSDFNSSLPIRTELNGDVAVKLVDGTTPSQALAIDSAGRVITKNQDGAGNPLTSQVNGIQRALDVGINVAGVQVDPRAVRALTATDVVTANQGTANTIANGWTVKPTDGTNSQGYLATGEAKVSVTQPIAAGTNNIGKVSMQDGTGNALTSVVAGATRPLDVDLRDSSGNLIDPRLIRALTAADVVTANIKDATGNPFSTLNPLPVTLTVDNAGAEIDGFNTVAALAAAGVSNHDYTVSVGKTLLLTQVEASASGKLKIEIQVETAAASGVFTTKYVQFNSSSVPNTSLSLRAPIAVLTGARVRVIRTNRDALSQDVYSTIVGQEI